MKVDFDVEELSFVSKYPKTGKKIVNDIGNAMLYLLEKQKKVAPKDLVNLARPVNSKIHKYFEWNNGVAGEKWREQQARCYIGWIQVTNSKQGKSKAFASVQQDNSRGYMLVNDAIQEPDLRKQLLNDAIDEIEYWTEQYQTLKELKPIFRAVQKVKSKIRR